MAFEAVINDVLSDSHAELPSLDTLINSTDFSDISLILEDGQIIRSHKVLISRSPYLLGMLTSGLSESMQKEINLKVHSKAFNIVLYYLYTNKLKMNLEEIIPITELADMFILPSLLYLCELYIIQNGTINTIN